MFVVQGSGSLPRVHIQQKLFVLHLTVYVYDQLAETFKQLPDMPADLPHQVLHANEALQEINAGKCCTACWLSATAVQFAVAYTVS